jgi:hypothetical protein
VKALRPFLILLAPIVIALGFLRVVRPWYLRWGATDEEVQRAMPLDDHVPDPRLNSTMAITVDAPPERIWPWLVQMGDGDRAGYYSFVTIERMMGMNIANSWRILPQFQHVEVGEALDAAGTMTVLAVEPGHHLVLGPPASIENVRASWAFALYPIDARRTRLVTRVHGAWSYPRMVRDNPPWTWPFYLLIEPGAFLMEWKMLREIRTRAERMPEASDAGAPATTIPASDAARHRLAG